MRSGIVQAVSQKVFECSAIASAQLKTDFPAPLIAFPVRRIAISIAENAMAGCRIEWATRQIVIAGRQSELRLAKLKKPCSKSSFHAAKLNLEGCPLPYRLGKLKLADRQSTLPDPKLKLPGVKFPLADGYFKAIGCL